MKLGHQKYAIIMPIIKSRCCITLNNKLNNLQRYGIVQSYLILHSVVQRLSQYNLNISYHRHI
jgi:hypothetical protein